jgi:hypothetical protein
MGWATFWRFIHKPICSPWSLPSFVYVRNLLYKSPDSPVSILKINLFLSVSSFKTTGSKNGSLWCSYDQGCQIYLGTYLKHTKTGENIGTK